MLMTSLQDVLKTSSRRLVDLWPKRIYSSWSRRLRRHLKTYDKGEYIRLEDIWKTISEDKDKRCLQEVFTKQRVYWAIAFMKFWKQAFSINIETLKAHKKWYAYINLTIPFVKKTQNKTINSKCFQVLFFWKKEGWSK